jgi:hypothetical protein
MAGKPHAFFRARALKWAQQWTRHGWKFSMCEFDGFCASLCEEAMMDGLLSVEPVDEVLASDIL